MLHAEIDNADPDGRTPVSNTGWFFTNITESHELWGSELGYADTVISSVRPERYCFGSIGEVLDEMSDMLNLGFWVNDNYPGEDYWNFAIRWDPERDGKWRSIG